MSSSVCTVLKTGDADLRLEIRRVAVFGEMVPRNELKSCLDAGYILFINQGTDYMSVYNL